MIPTYLSIVITFFFLFTKNLGKDVLIVQKKDEIVRNVQSI